MLRSIFISLSLIGGHFGVYGYMDCSIRVRIGQVVQTASIAKMGSRRAPLAGGWILLSKLDVRYIFTTVILCPLTRRLQVQTLDASA